MSRFTQYIGISPEASEFLSRNNNKVLTKYHMTDGIVFEPVMGSIYEVNIKREENETSYSPIDDVRTYVEVVQAEPWSSGPMIFTCLLDVASGEKCFLWKQEKIDEMS